MIADCKYCGKCFEAKTYRKLFCTDACKTRYNRENRLMCFFCGDLPGTRDHVTPHTTMGLKRRIWSGIDYVNACRECNGMMGANHPFVLSDRIGYLIEKFTKKYKLHKARVQWSEDEISEEHPMMAREIRASIKLWNNRNARLDHMRLRQLEVFRCEEQSTNKNESDE